MIERVDLAIGYSVCRIVNGLWQLSRGHRSDPVDQQHSVRDLLRLVDAGLTTFDCADIYLGVEELLGLLVKELRDSHRDPTGIQIHTKYVPDRSALPTLSRADVTAAVEASLTRIGIDRLDLVQFHWWDFDQPGFVETAGWLAELCDEGKIRCLGTTNFDSLHLEELAAAGIPIVSNQAQYSLLDRRVERSMTGLCGENGIRLLCYGVLAGGFLSRRYLGADEPQPPFKNRSLVKYKLIIDEFGGWNLQQELLRTLDGIARKHAASIATIATRWVLDRVQVGAAMIGTKSVSHLEDTLRVFDVVLDQEDRDRIDVILARAMGPNGEPFELEREPEGRHSAIMWTDLNRRRNSVRKP